MRRNRSVIACFYDARGNQPLPHRLPPAIVAAGVDEARAADNATGFVGRYAVYWSYVPTRAVYCLMITVDGEEA